MLRNEDVKEAKTDETKMLGQKVPVDLYWAFKKKAAERQESMTEAVINAALLYVAADGDDV